MLGSLRGRGSLGFTIVNRLRLRAWPTGQHDNTAPKQFMTAAEMLQAVADIRSDAESRLLEIQAQIQDLEAEAEQLEELING